MPHLSEITELLQRLQDKVMEWQWLTQHSIAFNTVKKYLTESAVLKYYNINEEVTIQCDASETGLGAPHAERSACVLRLKSTYRLWDQICPDWERTSCHHMLLSLVWPVHTWPGHHTRQVWPWATTSSVQEAYTAVTQMTTERECTWHYKIILWMSSTRKAV